MAAVLLTASSFVRSDVSELYLPPHHGSSHSNHGSSHSNHGSTPSKHFLPPATSYGVPSAITSSSHGASHGGSYADGLSSGGSAPAVVTHVHNGGHSVVYVGTNHGHEGAGSSHYNHYAAPASASDSYQPNYEEDHSHHHHQSHGDHSQYNQDGQASQVTASSNVAPQTVAAPAVQLVAQAAYPQPSGISAFSYIIPTFSYFVPAQIQSQLATAASTLTSQTSGQIELGGAKYATNGGYAHKK